MSGYSRRVFIRNTSKGIAGAALAPSLAATMAGIEALLPGSASAQTNEQAGNGPADYSPMPIAPPPDGCYLGMYPHIVSPKDWYIQKFGMEPKIVIPPLKTFLVYRQFPQTLGRWISEKGSTPFFYRDLTHDISAHGFHNLIDNPAFTREIKAYAASIVKLGKPLFLSTMRKMNGGGFPWSNKPQTAKNIWKYMWRIFEGEGANQHATWVLVIDCLSGETGRPADYYPGDKFVDWIGLSANSRSNTPIANESFETLFENTYRRMYKEHRNKPIMVAEFSKTRSNQQAKWFGEALSVIKSWPGIKAAICWSAIDYALGDDATFTEDTFEIIRKFFQDPYYIGS